MASDKTYRAQIQLGTITDTYDMDGEVVETRPLPADLDRGAIWVALGRFVGDIMQAPPAYSAIKQDGVPLHRRARRGEDVRPVARPVHIHSIQLDRLDRAVPDSRRDLRSRARTSAALHTTWARRWAAAGRCPACAARGAAASWSRTR